MTFDVNLFLAAWSPVSWTLTVIATVSVLVVGYERFGSVSRFVKVHVDLIISVALALSMYKDYSSGLNCVLEVCR